MANKKSLKKYNSFGIEAHANDIVHIKNEEQLKNWHIQHPDEKFLILGEGSNVLFLNDFDGTILFNEMKGKKILQDEEDFIRVHIKGGEKWHDIVMWAVNHNYGGIENLALIPGKTGTAPIQNIGAYGKEIKEVIDKVYVYDFNTQQNKVFLPEDCQFGYRDSIFKKPENKKRYYITAVDLKLTKKNHRINISYGAIQNVLQKKKIEKPNLKEIAEAVIEIRKSKLPDPKEIGNAGSFFKNPVIDKNLFIKIQNQFPDIPSYPQEDNKIKIPAGWLIEKAGFKGKKYGPVGVHEKQALVLVNFGKGNGRDIKELAERIMKKIHDQFGIQLQPEVNFIE